MGSIKCWIRVYVVTFVSYSEVPADYIVAGDLHVEVHTVVYVMCGVVTILTRHVFRS